MLRMQPRELDDEPKLGVEKDRKIERQKERQKEREKKKDGRLARVVMGLRAPDKKGATARPVKA